MPNYLILIRHSQPQTDPNRPAREWPLSETGRLRCIALADRLAAYHPELIVTSVEPKASETGALAAARLGIACETAAGLHEHRREHTGWMSNEMFDQTVAAFFQRPNELVFGDETASQARARFTAAVQDVLAAHLGVNIAITTHGTVMTLFVAEHANVAPLPFWKRLGMPALVVLSLPDLELIEVVESVEIHV